MRLLCIGGSDAGISAALRARELEPHVEVTVVLDDAFPNLSICGLPFYLSGETPDWRDLAHRTADDLRAAGLELFLNTTVNAIRPDDHVVDVTWADGGGGTLAYDRVVIATGAEPVRPTIRGQDLPGVHVLHTMGQAFGLAADLDAARRAVVVGGGYIGMELADALAHRGLQVTVIEMAQSVLPTFDPELGDLLAAHLTEHGVEVRTGSTVSHITQGGGGLSVAVEPGDGLAADVVVLAVGVRPRSELGHAIGIPTGVGGALVVDDHMQTGLPDVLAAGDCVHTRTPLTGDHRYLPLGTTAHKQGRVAGATAVGHRATFAGSLGTQAVKVIDLVAARTGLRHDEAVEHGMDARTVALTVDDHKAYYPGATDLHIRLTADGHSGRVLGAQLLGHRTAEVAKRVDVYVTAIHHGMTVDDISTLDLSYTPPLSAPWDPIQQAAQAWSRERTAIGDRSARDAPQRAASTHSACWLTNASAP